MTNYLSENTNSNFNVLNYLALFILLLFSLFLGCQSSAGKGEATLIFVDQNGNLLPNIELEIQNKLEKTDENSKIFYTLDLKQKIQSIEIKLVEGSSKLAFGFNDPEKVNLYSNEHVEYLITLYRQRQIIFETSINEEGVRTKLSGVEIIPEDENIYLESGSDNLTDANGRLVGYINPEIVDNLKFSAEHQEQKLTKNINLVQNEYNYNLNFVFNEKIASSGKKIAPSGFSRLVVFSKNRDIPFRIIESGRSSSLGNGIIRPRYPVSRRSINLEPKDKSIVTLPLELQPGSADSILVDFNRNRYDLWRKGAGEKEYQRIKRNVSF